MKSWFEIAFKTVGSVPSLGGGQSSGRPYPPASGPCPPPSLHDLIAKARRAQEKHERRIDIQLRLKGD